MNKLRPFLLLLILLFPLLALHAAQQTTPEPNPAPRLEITGVNASQMPTVSVTANVYDTLGQPVQGLTAANFAVTGDLADKVQISKVENISDDNLPFATVLAIDISTSMAGKPLDDAKQAAHAYIQSIRDNDPVAIITFASHVTIVQNYTTDKNTLNNVIDSLEVAGETALYQGAYEAVDLAASSPTPRRALILLSDGAEYGNISKVSRGAPAQEALVKGVPVYTIGLGYGFDRTFMQQLSSSTNAHFYETPTPDQLTQIYTALAAQLRSQYVITLNAPLPLNGTEYTLGLEVTTPQGKASASATLRAPIPVPIVSFSPINGTITQPTDVTAIILHDDPLTNVTFTVSGQQPVTVKAQPYTFTINPVDYPPGNYTLTASATDNNGDTGTAATGFTIGALPSQIQLSPDLASLGEISKTQTVTIQATGQTPIKSATVDFNKSGKPTTLTAPFSFTLDPLQFQPGNNSLTVTVTNQGGVTSSKDFTFKIAALPPQITISGLQDGQTVDKPLNFTVMTTSQTPVTQVNVSASEFVLTANSDGSYTLDPAKLPPGDNALVVQATSSNQQFGQAQVNFVVPPLPPTIIVNGLMAGEVLHQDRDVTLDFIAQEPVIHVAFFIDGADLAHEVHTPYGVTIKVLDYAPGSHILRIIADEANGQESTLDVPFSIAPEPAATATAAALLATQSALATTTQQAVMTAASIQGTQAAHATATQVAQASQTAVEQAVQATATQVAQVSATAAQATQSAHATATQAAQASATQNSLNATATRSSINAVATQAAQNQQATAAQATLNAQATATQVVQNQQATATQVAQASATAAQVTQNQQATVTQAAQNQQATATDAARATQLANNLATLNAQITATAVSRESTATQQAVIIAAGNAKATQQAITDSTSTAVAQASATQSALNAGATQVAFNITSTQSALNTGATQAAYATATQIAQATASQIAQATQAAFATATQNAQATATQATQNQQATATQIAQATVGAQSTLRAAAQAQMQAATLDALSTANAEARLQAQATQSMRATRSAQATATQETNLTSTAVLATATQVIVNATATAAPYATATQQANATATQAAAITQATTTAVAQNTTATQIAQQTLAALESTATQVVIEATQTRIALETQAAVDAISTQVAINATSTQSIQATQIAVGTMIAQVTQTEQQAAINATSTAYVNATMTQSAASTATSDAATLDTRLTAIGPTATPITGGAQNALTLTPQPSPTLTEVQAQQPPIETNIAPIAIVLIVILVIIIVLVLILRRPSPPAPRR